MCATYIHTCFQRLMVQEQKHHIYPGITSVSAGGTYPPACIVGTSVNSKPHVMQQPSTNSLPWTPDISEIQQ